MSAQHSEDYRYFVGGRSMYLTYEFFLYSDSTYKYNFWSHGVYAEDEGSWDLHDSILIITSVHSKTITHRRSSKKERRKTESNLPYQEVVNKELLRNDDTLIYRDNVILLYNPNEVPSEDIEFYVRYMTLMEKGKE